MTDYLIFIGLLLCAFAGYAVNLLAEGFTRVGMGCASIGGRLRDASDWLYMVAMTGAEDWEEFKEED